MWRRASASGQILYPTPSAGGTVWANVCFRTMHKSLPRTKTERYIVLIGERLHKLCDDIVQQELPSDIKAAIERLAARLANKR
jgi:hypothetical protein